MCFTMGTNHGSEVWFEYYIGFLLDRFFVLLEISGCDHL
jgi:hypothetical protein